MRYLSIILCLTLFTMNVQAEEKHEEKKGEKHHQKFPERKAKVLSNIEARIGFLNEKKACVSAASNHDGIKACRKEHKKKVSQWEKSH